MMSLWLFVKSKVIFAVRVSWSLSLCVVVPKRRKRCYRARRLNGAVGTECGKGVKDAADGRDTVDGDQRLWQISGDRAQAHPFSSREEDGKHCVGQTGTWHGTVSFLSWSLAEKQKKIGTFLKNRMDKFRGI